MRGGQLDRRITFLASALIEDEVYGPQPGEWLPAAGLAPRTPAQVWDSLPGQDEAVQGGLHMADRPARIRLRYQRGITSDMRVVLHDETDRLFEITGGPAEIGRREWIELTIKAFSS